ncbi:MAG: hypothetical protein HXX08_12245 [Chloroflexi bacterium]|uniref:Uncharacterized protein n=1 Tax=Candidatus Chlorohelix allophototropha TaxID=3003348 RepID=A0A8T7M171_9CHLR|nr:hypothetical protein [Chloroflexota bacterium]WJW66012.1 hypothetical protein OZ401_001794 [Chloroflexota bacterium L227-S17]
MSYPGVETLSRTQKYDRLAFTFCRMGTTGLICWFFTPPIFILLVGIITILLYIKAVYEGVRRSRCFLRKPFLIMGFWSLAVIADAGWFFFLR